MYYLGIDIGASNIAAAIVTGDYTITGRAKAKVRKGIDAADFCDDIAAAAREAVLSAGIELSDVSYCGIGCPGVISSHSGVLEYASNLGFSDLPLAHEISMRLEMSTYIENDANCAALGEVYAGAAKDAHSALVVTVGTGIGGGIVIDGKVYSGVNGIAGEIGHMVICPGGHECSCGRKGCWEAYSSATGLINTTREKIEECMRTGRKTAMIEMTENGTRVSGRTSFNAMRAGDEAAKEVVDMYIGYLACGLVNIINVFQPEILSIGGGISNEGENLLRPLKPYIEASRYGGDVVPATEIRIAKLGNDAGIIGGALLGMQK